MKIDEIVKGIRPLFQDSIQQAKQWQDQLIKPLGSLGRLEELGITIAGITGNLHNDIHKKAILIFCADNGVHREGVSTAPQEVTAIQTYNMLEGKTGISVLARQNNIDLKVVDIGICSEVQHPQLIRKKIAFGTKNTATEAAMTKEQLTAAIETGFDLVRQCKAEGYTILGTGEMGISNTTTATSVILALTGCSIEQATGKGAGLTNDLWEQKKRVLQHILEVNTPDSRKPLEVVQRVGGFDIAGLVGCFLGAAYYRIPIVIDGVISISAALAAYYYAPLTKAYMLPSHQSAEPAYAIAAEKIGLQPYFQLDFRLGEGSGCPFTMYLAEAAVKIMNEMATFEEGHVDRANYIDIREEKNR